MSHTNLCCQTLPVLSRGCSPFDAEIALGYYDGPIEGMVRCGGCGREYRFHNLESDEEIETRIFGLAPIPEGSVAKFTAAMARYQEARSPSWVPLWSFPTDEDRARMDDLVERIFDQARPIELIVASSSWLSREIQAARSISAAEIVDGKDWFATLGLLKAVEEE